MAVVRPRSDGSDYYWTLAFLFQPQKNTELHRFGLKGKKKLVLIRVTYGKEGLVKFVHSGAESAGL